MSDNLIVTIPYGLQYSADFVHLIEQELDKVLVRIGFTRTETTKGEDIVIKYHQFGKAVDSDIT
jgi:hypothetical protein